MLSLGLHHRQLAPTTSSGNTSTNGCSGNLSTDKNEDWVKGKQTRRSGFQEHVVRIRGVMPSMQMRRRLTTRLPFLALFLVVASCVAYWVFTFDSNTDIWMDKNRRANNVQSDPMKTMEERVQEASSRYLAASSKELSIYKGLGVGGILEMVDPFGGRSYKCLETYWELWLLDSKGEETTTTQGNLFDSFFEWLDYGTGRDTDIGDVHEDVCQRDRFDRRRYVRATPTERADYEVEFDVGEEHGDMKHLRFKKGIDTRKTFLLDQGNGENDSTWNLVWGLDRKLYLLSGSHDETGARQGHATPFAGRPVLFAGEIKLSKHGRVEWINSMSGHYKPKQGHMLRFVDWLRHEHKVNVADMSWRDNKGEEFQLPAERQSHHKYHRRLVGSRLGNSHTHK